MCPTLFCQELANWYGCVSGCIVIIKNSVLYPQILCPCTDLVIPQLVQWFIIGLQFSDHFIHSGFYENIILCECVMKWMFWIRVVIDRHFAFFELGKPFANLSFPQNVILVCCFQHYCTIYLYFMSKKQHFISVHCSRVVNIYYKNNEQLTIFFPICGKSTNRNAHSIWLFQLLLGSLSYVLR